MPALAFRPHALSHDCFVFCHPRGTRECRAPWVLRDRWVTWRFGSVCAAGAEVWGTKWPPPISNSLETDCLSQTLRHKPFRSQTLGKQLESWTLDVQSTPFQGEAGSWILVLEWDRKRRLRREATQNFPVFSVDPEGVANARLKTVPRHTWIKSQTLRQQTEKPGHWSVVQVLPQKSWSLVFYFPEVGAGQREEPPEAPSCLRQQLPPATVEEMLPQNGCGWWPYWVYSGLASQKRARLPEDAVSRKGKQVRNQTLGQQSESLQKYLEVRCAVWPLAGRSWELGITACPRRWATGTSPWKCFCAGLKTAFLFFVALGG